jgi:ribosome maturation protein Sdo1
MSEAVAVEMDKKMSKVGAIRQAIAEMGAQAHSLEICERAAELCGADIDIRNVYQVRSNINTGRDTTAIKLAKKTAAPKVAVKEKAPKATNNHKVEKIHKESSEDDHLTAFFALWEAAKAFGSKDQAIEAINRLPAF